MRVALAIAMVASCSAVGSALMSVSATNRVACCVTTIESPKGTAPALGSDRQADRLQRLARARG